MVNRRSPALPRGLRFRPWQIEYPALTEGRTKHSIPLASVPPPQAGVPSTSMSPVKASQADPLTHLLHGLSTRSPHSRLRAALPQREVRAVTFSESFWMKVPGLCVQKKRLIFGATSDQTIRTHHLRRSKPSKHARPSWAERRSDSPPGQAERFPAVGQPSSPTRR
jgi:hypothetical protein